MAGIPNLKTIPEFEAAHPAFAGRMRWIRWRAQAVMRNRPGNGGQQVVESLPANGFSKAFLEIAGRIYVDVDEFWRIVEQQNLKVD